MSRTLKQISICLLMMLAVSIGTTAQYMREPTAQALPPNLSDVSIHQKLNAKLPPDLQFRDEDGRTVKLGEYFGHGRPLLFNLVYYECPMLCTEALNGLTSTLRTMKLNVGSDFDVLTVSFDWKETPELAKAKKKAYLERYNRPGAAAGWHFLTGDEKNVKALTDAVGFHFKWDEKTQQWAHATALMLLTPEGKLAQYYYGVEYPPKDLRLGLVEASAGKIGNLVDEVLLYCYHYDPRTGRYGAVITNIMRLAAAATMVVLGGFMFVMFRREKKEGPNANSGRAA